MIGTAASAVSDPGRPGSFRNVLEIPGFPAAVPKVRVHLPPAESHANQRFLSGGAHVHESGGGFKTRVPTLSRRSGRSQRLNRLQAAGALLDLPQAGRRKRVAVLEELAHRSVDALAPIVADDLGADLDQLLEQAVNDHGSAVFGIARVRMKLPKL